MKRIISIFLSLTLIISLIPLSVLAKNDEEVYEKDQIKALFEQRLYEKYGEDGYLSSLAEGDYSWDSSGNSLCEGSLSTDSNIMPLWGSGNTPDDYKVHGMIIDEANALCKEWGDTYITNRYLPLVKFINQKCDALRNQSGESPWNAPLVHGTKNYVATLKFLWDFALEIEKIDESSINEIVISIVGNVVFSTLPDSIKKQERYKELKTMVTYVVSHYYDTNKVYYRDNAIESNDVQFKSGQTKNKRCKYIIYGIMCHFIGDVYAHRILVPKKTVATMVNANDFGTKTWYDTYINKYGRPIYNKNTNGSKYFNPEDFVNFDMRLSLVEDVYTSTVAFNMLKTYYSNDGVPNTIVSMLNRHYVDNAEFYAKRVDEAIMTLACLINDSPDVLYPYYLEPINSSALINYEDYLIEMGYTP